jgi:hypothetical protein
LKFVVAVPIGAGGDIERGSAGSRNIGRQLKFEGQVQVPADLNAVADIEAGAAPFAGEIVSVSRETARAIRIRVSMIVAVVAKQRIARVDARVHVEGELALLEQRARFIEE